MRRFAALLTLALTACIPTAAPTVQPGEILAINQTLTPHPIPPAKYPDPGYFLDPGKFDWVQVVSGLPLPLGLQNARDGSGRLFVSGQAGEVLILMDGEILAGPFLDITSAVDMTHNEQGLLGLAFHPRYEGNGYLYVYYINHAHNSILARYQVSADDPNFVDPATEQLVLAVKQPFHNNNGGGLAFGGDGYLYWGLGDGGDLSDPYDNAQSRESLLGKILRLDVDSAEPYVTPPDNPFASGGGLPEIWALGVRNPWRLAFDTLTGDLYVGDVGQATYEEISFIPAGSTGSINLGWDFMEGLHQFNLVDEAPADIASHDPIFEYDHTAGCAVIGGLVYRGALPDWQGLYLFGDYCLGKIWAMQRGENGRWQFQLLYQLNKTIVAFGADEAGEIYIVTRPGEIFKLVPK